MSRAGVVVGLGIVAFGVTLGVYVGTHLSNDALTALTGMACGVGAVLPMAIVGALSLLRRRETANSMPLAQLGFDQALPRQYSHAGYPPVIVITSPALPNGIPANSWREGYSQGFGAPVNSQEMFSSGRQFNVIGEEEVDG